MGELNKLLITYHKKNTYKAKAAADNLCDLIKAQIIMSDRDKIGDNTKPRSTATYETERNAENHYFKEAFNLWDMEKDDKSELEEEASTAQSAVSNLTEAFRNNKIYSMGSNTSWQTSIGTKK